MATRPTAEARLLAHEPLAKSLLWTAVAFGFLAAVAVVALAYLTSAVVGRVFIGSEDLESVLPLFAGMVVLAFVRAALAWAHDALAQRASNRLKDRLRADLTGRLIELGPVYTARERSGELASVIVNGLDALDAYMTSYRPARDLGVIVPLFVLVIILVLDPPTTLVLLFTGPILVLLLAFIGSRAREITQRRFAELRWMSAFFLDMLQGLATLKAFGRSEEQVDSIREISRHYGATTMEVLRTAFQTALVLEWGGAVGVALVAVEISLRLVAGTIPFERALAVLIITPEFFLPLRQLAIRYHSGAAGRTAAERIFEILDSPDQRRFAGSARAIGVGVATLPSRADIRFEDVTLAYPGRPEPALRRLSLSIPDGQAVALVGPTGAGKSTVAALLLRFLEPDDGVIQVGDVDLATIDESAWRASLAWVPQLPHLFHGTIADNIRLARPGATMDEIRLAAREADADDFITALPREYDTAVGEAGQRLSGGQRQRIAIARAFLRDARLVILDEATAHLDSASEASIMAAVARLARRRTVLIVSHRLRLAGLADRVVVLEAGRAVETGPPTVLEAGNGPYSRLVATGLADVRSIG